MFQTEQFRFAGNGRYGSYNDAATPNTLVNFRTAVAGG